MHRRKQIQTLIFGLFLILSNDVLAQSGRGRSPGTAPPPRPTPKPNTPVTTVLGVPEGGKLVKQDVDSLTSRFILKNGLTLLIRERHSSPLATINIAVKAGPVIETDDTAGMSALTRRLIMKGSEERNAAAIDREVARLGGRLSATTTRELTTFRLLIPAESYQAGVELLGEMILKPAFNADDVKKAAAETLLESRSLENDQPAFAVDKLLSATFQTSSLKRGAGVSEAMLASVTREKAMAFYQSFYQPKNIVATVVGDVFSLQALGQLQLNFGNFKAAAEKPAAAPGAGSQKPAEKSKAGAQPPAAAPVAETAIKPASTEEPAQDKLRYANMRGDYRQTILSFGYRTAPMKADKEGLKEWATLEMLRAVLGLGTGSRLSQGLRDGQSTRDKTSVAAEASAQLFQLPQGDARSGFLVAQLRIDSGRIDRAEAEYIREIEQFRREIVGDGEMQRARAMFEKRYFDCLSRIESEAGALAEAQLLRGDFRFFDSDLARLRAVTPQDIQQAAAKYMALSTMTAVELEPVKAPARTFTPEKFADLFITFEPRAAQTIKPEEVKPALLLKTFAQGTERATAGEGQNIIISAVPLPIRDFSLLRGPRAYVREDKSLPLLSIGVYFQGGRLVEDQTTSGVTELMLRSMLKSTTTRKGELISQELESYGGEIEAVNRPDYYGFTLNVLSRNAENAVKLLLEIIENPFFDKAEVAREREILLADQLAATDDARERAAQLMWTSMFPGHPYGLPRYGLPEVVKAVTDEKLDAWYAKSIKRQLPLLILVGDTDGSALISRIFSEGLKRGDLDKTIKANLPQATTPPEDVIEQRARGTTTQSLGYRINALPPEKQNDYLALDMFANLAASGRLQEEMRDKQALTDEASLRFEQRLAAGAFTAELTTLPANEGKAKDTLLAALQASAASQTTDEEFEQARNATIGRYSIGIEDHPSRVVEYARAIVFGRKPGDVEAQPDLIRGLRKTDLKRVAEAALKSYQAGRGVVKGN